MVSVAEGAGLSLHYRFHDLRHGFVSIASARGGDVKAISMAVGHTSTQTTEIYMHTNMERLRAIAKLVEGSPRPYLPVTMLRDDDEPQG